MKYGMDMLLWTTHVTDAHLPQIEFLKKTGYDAVEIPMFRLDPDHYARLGARIRDIGLEPLALTSRTPEDSPISPTSPSTTIRTMPASRSSTSAPLRDNRKHIGHVRISENNRGTPGTGQCTGAPPSMR